MRSGYISYYDALGIKRNASSDEIRAAYKRQSLQLHPDKNAFGDPLMKYVNEAYETLSDEGRRVKYDRDEARGNRGGDDADGRDRANADAVRRLERRLEDSERKRLELKEAPVSLENEANAVQGELSLLESSLS